MTTKRRSLAFSLATLLLLGIASAGCGAMRASAARQKYINDQTQQHVFAKPITEVWPNVRTLLFEQGYQTKSSDTGGSYSIETEPNNSVRYLAQGVVLDEGSCRIEFTRLSQSPSGATSTRDLSMEWLLLQRVDPAAADAIEVAANAEGERAR